LPKPYYQDKDTCAIRLGFGHNEEEIEIIVKKKLKQAYDDPKIKSLTVMLAFHI
jgi:GntR family transcriptional regulator/MocR family aminotransferase